MILEYGEGKMAELMQALTRTLDIDSALMQVYGLDQHGIDSAWRQELGLDPLPKPDDPRRRPLLENIPDATIAPVLMPTFAPRETAPDRSSGPVSAPAPAVEAQPAPTRTAPQVVELQPTAAPPPVLEQPTAVSQESAAPVVESPDGSAPEAAAGGCSPPGMQGGFVGEIAFLLLLGAPLGLTGIRRFNGRKQ